MFSLESTPVTVQTVDLVLTGVNFMGEVDRLLRLLPFAATQSDSTLYHIKSTYYEEDQGKKSDISFISVERNRLLGW